jgi:hypothetical protein
MYVKYKMGRNDGRTKCKRQVWRGKVKEGDRKKGEGKKERTQHRTKKGREGRREKDLNQKHSPFTNGLLPVTNEHSFRDLPE